MKKEVVYTGRNDGIVNKLKGEGIRVTKFSNPREFKTSSRSVFLHFDDNNSANDPSDILTHHTAWTNNKGIPSICILKNPSLKKVKEFYALGFTKVFKESSQMTCLLQFLSNAAKKIPQKFLGKTEIFNSEIEKLYESLSSTVVPILIEGQSGVGKTHILTEMVKTLFPNNVYISKNLSEYSTQILESELFGHAKGAFTGALTDRKGLFEQANGGILFLDEIATIPLSTQQKILKVLEEKQVTPVGSNRVIDLDFRLITATCEDLSLAISEKRFREDLYYRLAIGSCRIPSINERAQELEEILFELQHSSDQQICFSQEAIDILQARKWKGNYRELQALLFELKLAQVSYVTPKELPKQYSEEPEQENTALLTCAQKKLIKSQGLPELIKKIEIESFKNTFNTLNGKTNKICDDLKISKSVYYRINQATENSYTAS